LASRNIQKLEAAASEVKRVNPDVQVVTRPIDFGKGDVSEIKELFNEVS
jgi:short-subunit dehydrogenase